MIVPWLAACAGPTPDAADTDTGDPEPTPVVWLVAGDADGETAAAWATWVGADARIAAWDDESTAPAAIDLVVLLPDLPRESADAAERWIAHGGSVLGMGVGGARAYDGLDNGLGLSDGGQGAVDAMEIVQNAIDDPLFAGITIPADRVVTVTEGAITDVGIQPSAGVLVLAWDFRYPNQFADLCHVDRLWFWGWGDATEGRPDDYTADGDAILRALFDTLAPR